MNVEEMKNSEIWNEIKNGNFNRIEEMTEITPEIADILVEKSIGKADSIVLNIASISDSTAKILARHKGGRLWLNGLKLISPATARNFVKHKTDVSLCGLVSITNEVAKILSEYENIGNWTGLSVELNIREIIEYYKKENIEILDKIKSYPFDKFFIAIARVKCYEFNLSVTFIISKLLIYLFLR